MPDNNLIPFRLRKKKDDDLDAAFLALPEHIEKSDIIREALRMYFFDAPTPLRDSYVRNDYTPRAKSLPPTREVKEEIKQIEQPQPKKEVITPTARTVVSNDLDKKLNSSLGF